MPVVRGCGLCRASGVYRRGVVEEEGAKVEIVVVRFRCRGFGPRRAVARTFSVLPADVIPRRKWSLGWVLKVALWCSDTLVAALDELSAVGMAVESRQLARVLEVLGIVCERLHQHPLPGLGVTPEGPRRRQAGELRRACLAWEASGRGPPSSLVLAWQRQWKSLLLDVRVM
jgi:hypothetical protein